MGCSNSAERTARNPARYSTGNEESVQNACLNSTTASVRTQAHRKHLGRKSSMSSPEKPGSPHSLGPSTFDADVSQSAATFSMQQSAFCSTLDDGELIEGDEMLLTEEERQEAERLEAEVDALALKRMKSVGVKKEEPGVISEAITRGIRVAKAKYNDKPTPEYTPRVSKTAEKKLAARVLDWQRSLEAVENYMIYMEDEGEYSHSNEDLNEELPTCPESPVMPGAVEACE